MLTVNDTIISRKDLCQKFGIDYERIEKRPEFEGTQGWVDRANGNKKRFNAGYNKLSRFWVEDKKTQMPMEIRYSVTRKFSKEKDGWDYSPQRVSFEAEGMQLSEDLDLAVFAYLHPSSGLSPFNKGKSSFEFVDVQARSDKKIADLDALGESIVHAKTITGLNSVLLAKGLGIAGIEGKGQKEITAELMEFAHRNPQVYLDKKNQQLTMIEGKIEHFIDKDIFHMDQIGQVRRWTWTKGEREGEVIIDIVNTTANAREALKNHIKSDLERYMYLLNNITTDLSSNEKALEYLSSIKDDEGKSIGNELPEHLKNVGANGEMPTNFNEATTYLSRKLGKRASNKQISIFLGEITNNGLTEEAVDAWIENNISK